jgi:hypothetical protein
MRLFKRRAAEREVAASLCAAALLILALAVSAFHVHQDESTRDDCAICRFQQTTSASPIEEEVSLLIPESSLLPLLTAHQNPLRDLFRFHPVYPHAPPSAPTS